MLHIVLVGHEPDLGLLQFVIVLAFKRIFKCVSSDLLSTDKTVLFRITCHLSKILTLFILTAYNKVALNNISYHQILSIVRVTHVLGVLIKFCCFGLIKVGLNAVSIISISEYLTCDFLSFQCHTQSTCIPYVFGGGKGAGALSLSSITLIPSFICYYVSVFNLCFVVGFCHFRSIWCFGFFFFLVSL